MWLGKKWQSGLQISTTRRQEEPMPNALFHKAMFAAAVTMTLCSPIAAIGATPEAIVAAPDRSEADRQNDKVREPIKLLQFIGAAPGWHVLDMAAGAGYSTELMARAVAPNGKVFAQAGRLSDKLADRLKTPAMTNAEAVVTAPDNLSNPSLKNLDLVTFLFGYHDTTFLPVDRAKMDKEMFDALKPGGLLVIADHSAKPEDGISVGKTLHRIAEKNVRSEIEAVGFVFVASGDFLHHSEDDRSSTSANSPTPVDNFILKFRKP
jgi:predicted methyltransferase